jgi:DNA repair photolyase
MRAAIAYYMGILYFTVMFKPLIPIVKDKLSHTFAEAIHLATVHAVYGANHLQKEVDQSSSDNANDKHQNSNNEDQAQVHVSTNECKFDFWNAMMCKNHFTGILIGIISGFISKHSPPPKFS